MGGSWTKVPPFLNLWSASPTVFLYAAALSTIAALVCRIWVLVHMLLFPHPPSKVGGHLPIIRYKVPDNWQMPLLLIPFTPWLYARESGCVFYPIGVIPHVAVGSPKTIICLFVSAKLFPDLKILQIFIAEISSP